MRYIVDISQNHVEEIKKLMSGGRFSSFAQFVQTALENQIYIEKTLIEKDPLSSTSEKISTSGIYPHEKNFVRDEVQEALCLKDFQPTVVNPPIYGNLACFSERIVEEKCWLWGQINRIFPIKIGLRVLLNMLEANEWVDLEEFRDKAAEVACLYGKILSEKETGYKNREGKVSTGLPYRKGDINKSKVRYKSHFLAYMRKDDRLDGAMAFLRFVNLKRDNKNNVLIGVTPFGYSFAKLENSIIERNDFKESLNENEIEYYLEHIHENVKGEFSAITWLLGKLVNGIKNIEEMNNEIKKEFGELWKSSRAVINTQRAGLTARMYELGLLEKKKDGIRVSYEVSTRGENFLRKYKGE